MLFGVVPAGGIESGRQEFPSLRDVVGDRNGDIPEQKSPVVRMISAAESVVFSRVQPSGDHYERANVNSPCCVSMRIVEPSGNSPVRMALAKAFCSLF